MRNILNDFVETMKTPIELGGLKDRLIRMLKLILVVGLSCFIVIQFLPLPSLTFAVIYAWGIVGLCFSIPEGILVEIQLWMQRRGLLTENDLVKEWVVASLGLLVGYGCFIFANATVVPLLFSDFHIESKDSSGGETYFSFFFKIFPLWFLGSYFRFQHTTRRMLKISLSQAQEINRILEQKHEDAVLPESPVPCPAPQEIPSFEVNVNGIKEKLDLACITHISVEEHYSNFFLQADQESRSIQVRMSLKDALKKLPAESFIQIHRSHIVNLQHVSHIEPVDRSYLLFIGTHRTGLPISRYRVPQVLPVLNEFLKPSSDH